MARKSAFTEEEDKLILSRITANPHNLQRVFRQIADETGKEAKAVSNRWYYLSKKATGLKSNTIFMTCGYSDMVNLNRKVVRNNTLQPVKSRRSKWRRILDIIFG